MEVIADTLSGKISEIATKRGRATKYVPRGFSLKGSGNEVRGLSVRNRNKTIAMQL